MSTVQKTPVLCGQGLGLSINNNLIVDEVNVVLYPGEILGIIGPNGAGKSTLLKLLARINQGDAGTLKLKDDEYENIPSQLFARSLAYLEQRPQVHWPLTVEQVIKLGRLPWRGSSANDDAAFNQAVSSIGLEKLLHRTIDTLSEGEKMLVNLARILAQSPDVILADEPVAALDPFHQRHILDVLKTLADNENKTASIVVLHDLDLAAQYCDKIMLMAKGKIVSQGSPQEVLSPETLQTHYQIASSFDSANSRLTILGKL